MTEGKKANWTIMIYIQADDSLVNFAVQSLRQLKRAASAAGGKVKIAAQFDASGRSSIPRYIFDGDDQIKEELTANFKRYDLDLTGESKSLLAKEFISSNIREYIASDTNMADPLVLSKFIEWAREKCDTEHYCLILWGHGPELLLDDYRIPGSVKMQKSFLSPIGLRTALERAKCRFQIIGIDACCSSMLELAYEIRDYADFLIASQEEVPDFSLPYETLLTAFNGAEHKKASEGHGDQKDQEKPLQKDPQLELCIQIPRLYAYAYQGFILDEQMNMGRISLSSISLRHLEYIKDHVRELADELLKLAYAEETRQLLIDTRAKSKSFVAGLYVDLWDFCEQLTSRLMPGKSENSNLEHKMFEHDALISVCNQICAALRPLADTPPSGGTDRTTTACVIENRAPGNERCHGLSLYFPYLTEPEKTILQSPLKPLVKGSLDAPNKGSLDAPNKGAVDTLNQSGTEVLSRVRRQKIGETEAYYGGLEFALDTGWYEFIQKGWTRCLVENAELKAHRFPEQDITDLLDEQYSAQQCAINLLACCHELEKPGSKSEKLEKRSGQALPDDPLPAPNTGNLERHEFAETTVTLSILAVPGNGHGT